MEAGKFRVRIQAVPHQASDTAAIAKAQALLFADKAEAAEELLRGLLAARPQVPPARALYARSLRELGRVEEARLILEQLVKEFPGDFSLRYDLAEILLQLGEFQRGWREYRHRYRMAHTSSLERKIQCPRWDGQPLRGRRILIHDEQGFGDALQFLRFVPQVKQRGGHVILQVHPALLELAGTLHGYDQLLGRDRVPPPFDVHCELMNLPMVLGLCEADLPGCIPYLQADPALAARWRERLSSLPRPLVALSWAGAPAYAHDRKRSLSLARLSPLAAAGVTFVSIQKGPRARQAESPPAGLLIEDLSAENHNFDDTAAILSVVDLLVSSDSSPVHLAGALARPVWTLLSFVPEWRWLLHREDSPWYPTMRLFRQPTRGDWAAVLDRVAQELAALFG
jgi:tetratricopeptide (TPR) repeat protein